MVYKNGGIFGDDLFRARLGEDFLTPSRPSRLETLEDYAGNPQPSDKQHFEAAKLTAQVQTKIAAGLHFRIDRTLTGQELAAALKQSLTDKGISPDDVLVRHFSQKRLDVAQRTGTDRDHSANVDYNGEVDGESRWMRGLGIWGRDQVTYAAPIGKWLTGGASSPKHQDEAFVLYDKRMLYKVGRASNGFHAFLTSPNQACIGFMSDHGNQELSSVASPKGPTEGPQI